MRALTTMTTRVTKRARATRDMTEPSAREEGDDGPPRAARVHNNQLCTKETSTARNVVATTVRVTMKAARATVAGATRTTATTVATVVTMTPMTPNGDEDNEDGNSKNNTLRQ
jgi:hypothetical protein